jgi:hypothetical protein
VCTRRHNAIGGLQPHKTAQSGPPRGGYTGGSHCHQLFVCRQRRCCRCSLPEVGGCVISDLSVVQQTLQLQPAIWLPHGVGHLVGAWSAPYTDTSPALFEGSSCQDAVTTHINPSRGSPHSAHSTYTVYWSPLAATGWRSRLCVGISFCVSCLAWYTPCRTQCLHPKFTPHMFRHTTDKSNCYRLDRLDCLKG